MSSKKQNPRTPSPISHRVNELANDQHRVGTPWNNLANGQHRVGTPWNAVEMRPGPERIVASGGDRWGPGRISTAFQGVPTRITGWARMIGQPQVMGWTRITRWAGGAVLVAFTLDLLGEPPAAWHPVVWYGKLIKYLERSAPQKPTSQFFYGILMLVLAAPAALLPASIIHLLTKRIYNSAIRNIDHDDHNSAIRNTDRASEPIIAILLEGIALKPFFALRMLVDAGRHVRISLEQDELAAARQALAALVSRDRSQLSSELVAAAVIESLAENLSDSLIAPLFYYLLFGLPGAAAYRLFNTFDSMIGYHGRYEYLGKAAARLDDLLNLLPSRLTALLIIAFAPLFGGRRDHAWRIWRRDARKTTSPNAGHPMAATAGALGLQLEKPGHYTLGDPEKTITAHDIKRAEHMVWLIGSAAVLLTSLLKLFWRNQNE